MKAIVTIKDGNEKLKALEEVESHIKEAKRLLMWALESPIEIEMQEPPAKDGSDN